MMRRDLFGQLSNIPGLDLVNMGPTILCQLFLYGSPQRTVIENRLILEATMWLLRDLSEWAKKTKSSYQQQTVSLFVV